MIQNVTVISGTLAPSGSSRPDAGEVNKVLLWCLRGSGRTARTAAGDTVVDPSAIAKEMARRAHVVTLLSGSPQRLLPPAMRGGLSAVAAA